MSWTAVAKKDFQDAARSRWLWGMSVLFVLFASAAAYFYSNIQANIGMTPGGGGANFIGLLGFLLGPTGLLVPIIGLMISYKAIVGERESGSLKLMLSMPHSRGEMVLGKLVGRALSTFIAIVVGFAVAAIIVVVEVGNIEIVPYVLFVLLTMFFALVYISIGVAFSSLFASTSKALAGAVGLFALLEFLWSVVPLVLIYVLNGFTLQGELSQSQDELIQFVSSVSPSAAYSNAAVSLIPEIGQLTQDAPFFLQNWFGLVVLTFWLTVPLALGYFRFNATDL